MTTARQDAIKARNVEMDAAIAANNFEPLSPERTAEIDAAHPIPPRRTPRVHRQEDEGAAPEDAAAEAEHDPNPKHLQEQARTAGKSRLVYDKEAQEIKAETAEQPAPTPNPVCVAVLSFDTGPDRIMVVSSPQWLEQAADTMPGERHIYGNGMQGERWGFRLNTLRQWTCKVVTPPQPAKTDLDDMYEAQERTGLETIRQAQKREHKP